MKINWEVFCVMLVAVLISVIVITSNNAHTERIRIFVENGYTRKALIGTSEVQWVKVKESE